VWDERNGFILIQAIPHVVGIFAGVVIMLPENRYSAEAAVGKEQLCRDIRFANFQNNFPTTLLRQFVDQPLHHLSPDAISTHISGHGEVQNAKHGLVQFVDHEAYDPMIQLSHSADAVPLAKTAEKFFLSPGKLEASSLDRKYFIHIATNEPSNLGA
jgi:hypothetical protein